MDPIILSRLQFAITTIYHFFFVPLTMGLAIIVALMETIYVRTGREVFKSMTKFWGKLFVINFAMGVVTGIVQEFQFGMNWADYSRFVGDIFGAPLAIEALLAFFLESVFLGVWIFGWKRLSKGMHAAAIWLVAIGSNVSALWILIANAFMQQPVGYAIENGRAVMTDFAALVFNPKVWVMFPHTVSAGLVTAAFFVMGISAYHLLRKQFTEIFNHSFKIAGIIGAIAVVLVALNGHSQAQHMGETQPMKMASAEALWETEDPASLSILTIGDLSLRNEVFSIRIPNLLSLLSFNQIYGEVKGINDLQVEYEGTFGPGNYIPPVAIIYWSFRAMIGIGVLLLLLGLYALFLVMSDSIEMHATTLKLFIFAIFLPFLANILLRFWGYQDGRIRLGGHELSSYRQAGIRASISFVSQRPHIFNASIRENLLLGNPHAKQGEILRACQTAQIDHFIETLPHKFDIQLGEGGLRLSAGERQRVAIARALLKNTPIAIFDEPTANLDSNTERDLVQALFTALNKKTMLWITHRLVGMHHVDEIFVMAGGEIIERGRHPDLITLEGAYKRMWDLQNQVI